MKHGFLVLAFLGILAAGGAPSFAEDTADLILQHGVFYPVQPPGRKMEPCGGWQGKLCLQNEMLMSWSPWGEGGP